MSWGAPPAGSNPAYNPYTGQTPAYGQQQPYQGQNMYGGVPAGYAGATAPGGAPGGAPAGYAGAPSPAGYAGAPSPAGYAGVPAPGAPQAGYGQSPSGYPGAAPVGGYGSAPPQNVPPAASYNASPQGLPPGHHRPPAGYQTGPASYQTGTAPPPGGYGYQTTGYGAPVQGYGAPPPMPPGVSPEVWQWFQAVDQDRSGEITAIELRQALMNTNMTPFNPETCRLMIGMFDRNHRNGKIDVSEFSALWKYIQEWKGCFERFDTDRSGNINEGELLNAFRTFGYNLSPQFSNHCIRVFDRRGTRCINFDDFIQCCVMLKSLTESFRSKDVQQQGVINLQYEDFLRMVLENSATK